ncbi:hypothetical protein DRO66_08725 [Candidatus Bathyarchaeota archaeon]|nr:MAG: hypothetical protein DRO66_08725 [Candidatus Bathyarchaeota archaeon]
MFKPYSKKDSAVRPEKEEKPGKPPKPISKTRRKCKGCGDRFDMKFPNFPYCSKEDCSDLGYKAKALQAKKAVRREERKEWREEKAKIKKKLKTKSDYEKDLQKQVNHIARIIDKGQPCISSNRLTGRFAGGHFWSVGSTPSLRFNLHNIHIQTFKDNSWESGNINGYRDGLKTRYGSAYLELIVSDLRGLYPILKLSVAQIEESTVEARKIVKELLKIDKQYNSDQRIELRETVNERLGIYV